MPVSGRLLCTEHGKCSPHGLVTGAIPYGKLQEFLASESRRSTSVRRSAGAPGNRKRHWYTRSLMWSAAAKLDSEQRRADTGCQIASIDDLDDAEFVKCLDERDDYIRHHPRLQRRGQRGNSSADASGGYVEKDQGPTVAADRGSNFVEYNGFQGGRVFKWYTRPAFERHLRKRGWHGLPRKVEECTEQECMVALRATSDELRMFPMLTSNMVPYGVLQCFPNLRVQSNIIAQSNIIHMHFHIYTENIYIFHRCIKCHIQNITMVSLH